jgi:hypothetical protein
MKIIHNLSVVSAAVLLAGCSTFDEGGNTGRVATGAGVGAALGAAAGAVLGGVSPMQGAVAGAVAGGVAGALAKKDRRYFRDENGQCYYLTSAGGRVYDVRGCVDVVER